jgi:hypothetical protein
MLFELSVYYGVDFIHQRKCTYKSKKLQDTLELLESSEIIIGERYRLRLVELGRLLKAKWPEFVKKIVT